MTDASSRRPPVRLAAGCRRSRDPGPVAREVKRLGWDLAVGTGGTIRNLARMAQLRRRARIGSPLNGTVISRREVDALVRELLARRDARRRRGMPGLDPDRADIIPAGALILQGILEALGIRSLTVSAFALREGLLLDTLEKRRGRVLERVDEARRRSVDAFASRCGGDRLHGRRVARLALRLFDDASALHPLGLRERELLRSAAFPRRVVSRTSTIATATTWSAMPSWWGSRTRSRRS